MLENEVKLILEEQFSKEKNYKKVIYNIQKNQRKKYIKIIEYALLTTCAILVIVTLTQNHKTENIYNRDIAYIDNTKNEQNVKLEVTNNNGENESSIIDIEIPKEDKDKIEVEKNNDVKDNKINEKEVIKNNDTIQVAKNDIYKTIQGGEASWAYDPTVPENIIKNGSKSKYLIKVRIISIGEGEILPKQENFYNPFTCHTPIEMQIQDNLLSTNELSGIITAYITGGKIKISSILETATKQEIEYMGINDISQVDKEKYIEYIWADPFYEPKIGDEYVMIISKANENLYQICCGGYGIFKIDKSGNQERYINVITNKEWKIEN